MIAGTLEVQLLANMARLSSDMQAAKSSVTGAMDQIERSVGTAMGVLQRLGIGLSVAYFTNLVKGSVDAASHLQDLTATTRMSVEDLAGLKLLAEQGGMQLDGLAGAVARMSVEMGKSPEKFRELGVTATDSLGAFKQLSDIFSKLPDINQRNALANAVFGKSWADLAPVLNEGGQRIGEIITKGSRLSGVTTEMGVQADILGDKWAELATQGGGVVNRQVAQMLPLLTELAYGLLQVGEQTDGTAGSFNPLIEAMRAAIVFGGNVAFVLRGIGVEAAGMATQLVALAHGDLKGVVEIGREMRENAAKARAEFDAWEQRMMAAGKTPAAPSAGGGNPAANAAANAAAANAAASFLATGQAASKELDRLREQDAKGWVAYIDAQTAEYEAGLAAENKLLEDNNASAAAARQKDLAGWVAYAEARVQDDFEMAQQIAKQQIEAAEESSKKQRALWGSIEKTAHDSFVNIYKGGTDVFQRLQETLQNGLMELLYQMTVKKWIIQLEADMAGGGGGGNWFESLASIFGGSGGGSGAVNMGTATGADMAVAFADGGDHTGGLRLVGERGPELEATGPSRIFNAQQTRDILGGQGAGAVQITNAPVINIEARTDRADVYTNVQRALRQNNEQFVDMLRQQGVLA